MSVLINIKETMSSLQIAEITGKRHDNVMRDIRNLLEQGVAALNFEESYYKSEQNKDIQCFNLTKKGCLILASGYDAKLREQIIDRWEELETKNQSGGFSIPTSFKEPRNVPAPNNEHPSVFITI